MKEQIKELKEAYQEFKTQKGEAINQVDDLISSLDDLKQIQLINISEKLKVAEFCIEALLSRTKPVRGIIYSDLECQIKPLKNLKSILTKLHQTIISRLIDETNKLIDATKCDAEGEQNAIGTQIELLQKAWVILGLKESKEINQLITDLKNFKTEISQQVKKAENFCDSCLDQLGSIAYQKKNPYILWLHLKQIIMILKNAIIPRLYKTISSREPSKLEELNKFFNNRMKSFLLQLEKANNDTFYKYRSPEIFSNIIQTFEDNLTKNNLNGLRDYYYQDEKFYECDDDDRTLEEFLVSESTIFYQSDAFAIDLLKQLELLLNRLDPSEEQNIQNETALNTDTKPITLIHDKFKFNLTLSIREPTVRNVTDFLKENPELSQKLLQPLTKSRFLRHLIDTDAIKFKLKDHEPMNTNRFTVTYVLSHHPEQEIWVPDNFWFDANQVTIRQICHVYLGEQNFEKSLQNHPPSHPLSRYADFYVTNFLYLTSYSCLSFLEPNIDLTGYDLFSKIATALVYYCFDTDQKKLLPKEILKYSTISHFNPKKYQSYISSTGQLSSSNDNVTSEYIATLIDKIKDDDLILMPAELENNPATSEEYFFKIRERFASDENLKWKPILFKNGNRFVLLKQRTLFHNLDANQLTDLKFDIHGRGTLLASHEIPDTVRNEIRSKSGATNRYILEEFHDRLNSIFHLITNKCLLGCNTVINLLIANLMEACQKTEYNYSTKMRHLSNGFFRAIHAAERLPLDQRMAYYQNSLFISSVKKVCSKINISSDVSHIIMDYLCSYLTAYSSIPEAMQDAIIKTFKFEDFDNHSIIHSCKTILDELNIRTAHGVMVGPDSLSKMNNWSLKDCLEKEEKLPLEAKYIYFALPVPGIGNAGHAIAVVIDRNQSNIYCIDPKSDPSNMEEARHQLESLTKGGLFDGFEIKHPPIGTLMQQKDQVLCGAYAVSNIIGIITQLDPQAALSLNSQCQQIIQIIKASQINLVTWRQPMTLNIQKWKNLMILMTLKPTELQQLFYKEMVKNHNEQFRSYSK